MSILLYLLRLCKILYYYYRIRNAIDFLYFDSDIGRILGWKEGVEHDESFVNLRLILLDILVESKHTKDFPITLLEMGEKPLPGYTLLYAWDLSVNSFLPIFSKQELVLSKAVICAILSDKWGDRMYAQISEGTPMSPKKFRLFIRNPHNPKKPPFHAAVRQYQ